MDAYEAAISCGLENPPEYLKGEDFTPAKDLFDIGTVTDKCNKILMEFLNESPQIAGIGKSLKELYEETGYFKAFVTRTEFHNHNLREETVENFLNAFLIGRHCAVAKVHREDSKKMDTPLVVDNYIVNGGIAPSLKILNGNRLCIFIPIGILAILAVTGQVKDEIPSLKKTIEQEGVSYPNHLLRWLCYGVEEEVHAVDHANNPNCFDNYPSTEKISSDNEVRTQYLNHPAEVHAESVCKEVLEDFAKIKPSPTISSDARAVIASGEKILKK